MFRYYNPGGKRHSVSREQYLRAVPVSESFFNSWLYGVCADAYNGHCTIGRGFIYHKTNLDQSVNIYFRPAADVAGLEIENAYKVELARAIRNYNQQDQLVMLVEAGNEAVRVCIVTPDVEASLT